MALAAFDTLKFANRLKSVGVPLAQAEAEAEVLAEIFELNLRELATKEDLQRELAGLEQRLDAKHESLRKDVQREISDLRKDIDAKFANIEERFDTKFSSMEAHFEARFSSIEAHFEAKLSNMEERFNAKLLSMEERFNAKLDKLGLQLMNRLGGIVTAGIFIIAALPVVTRVLHLA